MIYCKGKNWYFINIDYWCMRFNTSLFWMTCDTVNFYSHADHKLKWSESCIACILYFFFTFNVISYKISHNQNTNVFHKNSVIWWNYCKYIYNYERIQIGQLSCLTENIYIIIAIMLCFTHACSKKYFETLDVH